MVTLKILNENKKQTLPTKCELHSVADPGFPRRGGATLEGAETYYLAKFLPKTAWKWKKK